MKESDVITKPLAEEGSKIALKYLKGELEGSEKVKYSFAAILAHIKLKATEANDDTNKLGVIKLIYQDADAREEYIRKTMPHMLLTDKAKKKLN